MKKRTVCLCLGALLLLLPLAACRNEARAEVEAELDFARAENEAKIKEEQTPPEPDSPPDAAQAEEPGKIPGIGGTEKTEETEETEETQPIKPAFKTDWDGITSSQYTLDGNKLYIDLKHKMTVGENQRAYSMLYCIDLITGDSNPICPDPLCLHNDPAVCPYFQARDWCFLNSRIAFANRGDMKSMNGKVCVWKYDLSPNLCTEFYKPKGTMAGIICAEDGVLYLQDNTSVIQDKKSYFTYYLIALDAESGKVLDEKELPEITAFYAVIRGRMLFADSTGAYFSDMSLENRERITDGYFDQWYWDEHTNELWFSQIDQDRKTGRVFKYRDGVCEQIDLPENLYFFQLTNTKIYYTTFETVYLGNALLSMWEDTPRPLYSDSGCTVFSVDRNTPEEPPTIVYDTEGKHILSIKGVAGYSIFGNKLCYYDIPLIRETHDNVEYVAYSLAEDLPLLVVDLETGEEDIIRFD